MVVKATVMLYYESPNVMFKSNVNGMDFYELIISANYIEQG